jgi:hypothetical protein
MSEDDGVVLLHDADWSAVADELCLVTDFIPMAHVAQGQVHGISPGAPYASVHLRSPRVEGEVTGFITHKLDFSMLWAAFKDRADVVGARTALGAGCEELSDELGPDEEEVWLLWTKGKYRGLSKFFGGMLPRLVVMVGRRGAFDLLTDPNVRPELKGEARAMAIMPLVTWTPEVMGE